MPAKVASLLIDVVANIAELRKGFDEATKETQSFQGKIVAMGKALAGVFAVREVLSFGNEIQKKLDDMADTAENLKLPFEDFQTLSNAALLAGQSVDNAAGAMAKFNQFVGKAEGGSKEQIDILNELHVNILNLDGSAKSTTDRLQQMAKAITDIASPTRRSAVEMEVFGKSGQKVSAILEQWKRPLQEVNQELSDQGLIHSPAVAKSLADMADASEKASQKLEVMFAIIYAPIKSTAMEWVAGVFERIAKSLVAMQGSESVIARLAELMNAFTGGGIEAAANAISGSDSTPLSRVDEQVRNTSKSIVELRDSMRSLEESGQASSSVYADQVIQLSKLEAALKRGQDAQRKLMPALPPITVPGGSGGTNPVPKATGVDKYAEAQRKVREETKAAQQAIEAYQAALSSDLPFAEAVKNAKNISDTQKEISQVTKGLTDDQAKAIEPAIRALKALEQGFEDTKAVQQRGNAIIAEYGDGTKALADSTWYLNQALAANVITQGQYNAALKDAQDKQRDQADLMQKNADGLAAMGAGFEYAMNQQGKALSSFNIGAQLFQGTFDTMSSSIADFLKTGQFSFANFAKAFGDMLIDMGAKVTAFYLIKGAVSLIGSAFGGFSSFAGGGNLSGFAAGAGPQGPSGGAVAASGFDWSSLFGGNRAVGGSVTPGVGYTVGENGPERFMPSVPGQIVPSNSNDIGSVTVNVNMTTGQQSQPTAGDAAEFGRRLKQTVVATIQNEQRPGGTLYQRKSA